MTPRKQRLRRNPHFAQEMRVCASHMYSGDFSVLSPRRQAVIHALMHQLTPRQQFCLYLYYGRQFTLQDIAEELGVSEPTISRTIARGEQKLLTCATVWSEEIPLNPPSQSD